MKRERTLSDEGARLFSLAFQSRPQKMSVRKFLFSCFHSDYDDRLRDVVYSCREATKALYSKLMYKENVNKLMDAGISHTTRILLADDRGKPDKHQVRKNYRFFLDVLERAFNTADHQTAMLMYLALTHSSVHRLDFKRPKKTKRVIDEVNNSYGDLRTCYSKHVKEAIEQTSTDYLPSVIALSMFMGRFTNYESSSEEVSNMLRELDSVIQIYSMMNFRESNIIQLYNEKQIPSSDLFQLSTKVQPMTQGKWEVNPFYKNKFVEKNKLFKK